MVYVYVYNGNRNEGEGMGMGLTIGMATWGIFILFLQNVENLFLLKNRTMIKGLDFEY